MPGTSRPPAPIPPRAPPPPPPPPPSSASSTSSVGAVTSPARDGDYHHPPPPTMHHSAMRVDDSDDEDDNTGTSALGLHGFPTPPIAHPNDDELDDLDEREPLIRNTSDGPTSSAISPSTGSADALRRNFRGQKAKRTCTDFWALVLFGAYWLGMLVLATYAFTRESNADFAKYIKDGIDFQGHACGEKQFVYFPDFRANPDFGICVDACPVKDGDELTVQLPLATGQLDSNGTRALETVKFKTYATHVRTYLCAPANVASEDVMISQLQDTVGRFVGALSDCWDSMLITCGIALGTASLYLIFLRYCGCFTVFLSTVGIEGILAYASYRLLQASADPLTYPNDPAMKSSIQITAVVVCCSAVLFCLLAFHMLPRLLLAGTFITHASKALHQLRRLLIVPFISYVMLLLLFWWAMLVTICIFGAGKTTTRVATVHALSPSSIQIQTESFAINYDLRWFFFYHVWGVYWTAMWILAIGEMITATAVSMWYFSPDDKVTSLKILQSGGGRSPVSYAFRSTFRFHLGTLALSSAVVTPISYVRSFFAYLEDKNEYDSNVVTTMLARCCCCCIWCFNYCLKFISKEAYYITSIQGTNFYPSAKLAHTLISSNLLRVGALSQIGHASVLLGKIIVCFITCFIGWFLVDSVSSPVLPLVAIALFSYGVAHAFMTIYETTINVLLMCFTLDENMHGGRGNTVHAHATLVRSVNDHLRPKWQTSL